MPSNVKQTLLGADMDMTHYKLSKEKLQDQILADVKSTQILLGRHLPDKMYITKDQFLMLEDDMQRLQDTEDRIYVTPYNAMEVKIVL
jgi:hypothetical protein